MPGFGPDRVSSPEFIEGSVGDASQKLFDTEHVEEGMANGRSSEPTGTDTNEGGSGPTSQDYGEDEEALNAEDHVVYEAITDPEVPPHIRLEKAKTMAHALAKGDPNTVRIAKQLLKGKLQEFHHSLAKAPS